jgi:hypothetical protein
MGLVGGRRGGGLVLTWRKIGKFHITVQCKEDEKRLFLKI